MSILHRKLLRELYRSKGLLLLISGIIAVGITCFVGMLSAYHNLDESKKRYYAECRMADFWIDLKKAPLAELERVGSIAGVAEFRTRIQFQTTVDIEGYIEPVNGSVLSLPDRRSPVINDVIIRRGDYFGDARSNEVLISEKFAETHNLSPGDTVYLLLNNRRQQLHIVGTVIASEFTYLVGAGSIIPDPEHFGVFYVKRSFAEDVFDFQGAANQVVGRLATESRDRVDAVLDEAELLLDDYGVLATTPLELQLSNQMLTNEINGLGGIAAVLPPVFLVVAALVLNVLITRVARRQRVVVGTLKALGYFDSQVFVHFLLYGIVVGVVGALLGSVLGYLSATGMTAMYRFFFELPDLRSEFYWYTYAIGMAVSIGCAFVGALRGARAMLKLQPAEAMRPEPPKRGGKILLEKVLGDAWTRLSATWRMALRSLFRHRFRTATGVFAATMGAGLLVSGFMMLESQDWMLEFQFFRETRSDIDLVFEGERARDAWSEVQHLPGVDYAEPTLAVPCTFVNGQYRRKGGVTGIQTAAQLTVPRDVRGEPIVIPTSGLVMTRRMADTLQVSPGMTVTMIPTKGEQRPVEASVARIADSYMGLTVYAEIGYLSRLTGESFAVTGAQLVVDDAHRAELYRELKRLPGLQSIQARRAMIDNLMETLLLNQYVFIGMLVVFSGSIFLGSIVNASMVNLAERQREVATFRALGYSEWQIGGMFLRESMLTTLFGVLLAVPVGYGLTWWTAISYENDIIRLPVVTAPWIWFTTAATAILFGILAHAVVQYSISRMNYVEALKIQE